MAIDSEAKIEAPQSLLWTAALLFIPGELPFLVLCPFDDAI